MKNIISAAFLMAILSTPALANKTLIGDTSSKDECVYLAQEMTVFHLDQLIMNIEQMRAEILKPVYEHKPKDSFQKAG